MTRDGYPNHPKFYANNLAGSDSCCKTFVAASLQKKGARYGHGEYYPQRG